MTAPTDLSRTHRGAVADLLAPLESAPTSYQIYLNKVTVPDAELDFPYLVIRGAPGDRDLINLTGTLVDLTTTTQIMAVGRDEDEVLAALDRAAKLLEGVKPVMPGRNPGFIRQVPGSPYVVPSDDVHTDDGQACYQGVNQFTLTSGPAPA